jgi:hypothetical protein
MGGRIGTDAEVVARQMTRPVWRFPFVGGAGGGGSVGLDTNLSESYRPSAIVNQRAKPRNREGGVMRRGRVLWAMVSVWVLGSAGGCRLCERWCERNYDPPPHSSRPFYYYPAASAPGACPPGCAPAAPACPPGCVPTSGYAPAYIPPTGPCN